MDAGQNGVKFRAGVKTFAMRTIFRTLKSELLLFVSAKGW
jgi:hypothetical protein